MDADDNIPWCSTLTDRNGNHVGGQVSFPVKMFTKDIIMVTMIIMIKPSMLSFRVKMFIKDILMVMVLTVHVQGKWGHCYDLGHHDDFAILCHDHDDSDHDVQGKWGHCPPTCNIINEGSSSQPESAPATVI